MQDHHQGCKSYQIENALRSKSTAPSDGPPVVAEPLKGAGGGVAGLVRRGGRAICRGRCRVDLLVGVYK